MTIDMLGGPISPNEAKEIVKNHMSSKGANDAVFVWFSFNELEKFISDVRVKLDPAVDGIRLYPARYTNPTGQQTVLIAATKWDAKLKRSIEIMNYDPTAFPNYDFGTLCPPECGCTGLTTMDDSIAKRAADELKIKLCK